MSRPRSGHLEWSKAHGGRHAHDLADSGVCAPDLEALGLPHTGSMPRDGYATALPALEHALGARLGAPGGRVLVTAGASEANAIVAAALFGAGDDVLVESPGYEPLRQAPELFGATVRPFLRHAAQGFGRVAANVDVAIGPGTRGVVLSDLHNPSGAALAEADVAALDALAHRRDVWMVVDETFRDAGPRPCATLASRGPGWVTTSSLTKAYGLGGLRIGWIAGGDEALARCRSVQNALSVEPSLPSVTLALALVPHLGTLRQRTHRILAANGARLAAWARERPWCDLALPPSGSTAWIGLPRGPHGDVLSDFAASHMDLAVTPGRFFGDPHGVRVALGGDPERFAAALDTLDRAVALCAGGVRSGGAR
jgi:aspartate/methionine/tyrosine aminotransferase